MFRKTWNFTAPCRDHATAIDQKCIIPSRVKKLDTEFGYVIAFTGLLKTVTISDSDAIAISYTLLFTTGCCVFTSRFLVTVYNTMDYPGSVYTFLLVIDCLIDPHGCNCWPLSPSRVAISQSVCRLTCCWSSPAQSFLVSVSSRSMTKIFILS
jgi:hypothetical protein